MERQISSHFSEHFRPIRYFSGEEQNENEAVTFTKQDYADPSMAENQDRITGNVWITRGTNQPLYNAALESGYQDESISPEGYRLGTGANSVSCFNG